MFLTARKQQLRLIRTPMDFRRSPSTIGSCTYCPHIGRDVAICQDPLHVVLRAEIERRLPRTYGTAGAPELRPLEHDLPWIVGNDPVLRFQNAVFRSAQLDMNLGRQGQRVRFPSVLSSDRRATSLWCPELHASVGPGVSRILVEHQIVRLEVDRTFELPRGSLIGAFETRRIANQIDLHLAFG